MAQTEAQTQIGIAAEGTSAAQTWLRRGLVLVGGSAFIALCAHIAVPLPWTPVPITFQPFAVVLIGMLFGPALGAATAAVYLLEGATGLPVFTPAGAAGVARLIGPTGGYLMSYPAAAALAGWLWRRGRARISYFGALADAAVASAPILICGAAWLYVVTHLPLATILGQAILPFLPGDFLKAALAAGIVYAWERHRRTSQSSGSR